MSTKTSDLRVRLVSLEIRDKVTQRDHMHYLKHFILLNSIQSFSLVSELLKPPLA